MPPAQPGSLEVRVQSLFARTPGQTIRQITRQRAARIAVYTAAAYFIIFSCGLLLVGCGAPGMPTPPSPPIPSAITDLTARQSGDGALLSFALPGKTATGKRLTENPACEIFRGAVKADPGGQVAYLVRTRISPKKSSADSNIVEVAVFPVPQRIAGVDAHVTENAIDLSWPPVTQTSGGEALADVSYRLFRGQLNSPVEQATI